MNVVEAGHSSAIGDASAWLTSMLTGSVAISLAVLAIAGVGYSLLNGTLQVRRGAMAVLGCFILFGAGAVAKSLMGIDDVQTITSSQPIDMEMFLAPSAPLPTQKSPSPKDPYAGAALSN